MDIDLRALRILLKVIETNSFSAAARALKLTQPTVSQQIARLEAQLGGRLFERVGHEIHTTELCRKFKAYALEVVERSDRFAEELAQDRMRHTGLVRYAMPESCQWTPHFREIMARTKQLPELSFEIGIMPSDQVLREVLEGRVEFGFALGERLQPELQFESYGEETYVAVAATRELLEPVVKKTFGQARWIAFPGWEFFLSTWLKKAGGSKAVREASPVLRIGTLAGAIHAIQEGAGIGILPRQCVTSELKRGDLQEAASGAPKPPSNPIHIVRRRGERLAARANAVLAMLREAKRSHG